MPHVRPTSHHRGQPDRGWTPHRRHGNGSRPMHMDWTACLLESSTMMRPAVRSVHEAGEISSRFAAAPLHDYAHTGTLAGRTAVHRQPESGYRCERPLRTQRSRHCAPLPCNATDRRGTRFLRASRLRRQDRIHQDAHTVPRRRLVGRNIPEPFLPHCILHCSYRSHIFAKRCHHAPKQY